MNWQCLEVRRMRSVNVRNDLLNLKTISVLHIYIFKFESVNYFMR
jgi:hypothetical protein